MPTAPDNNNKHKKRRQLQLIQPSTQKDFYEPLKFNYMDATIKSFHENKDIIIKKLTMREGICIFDNCAYTKRFLRTAQIQLYGCHY